MFQRRANSFPDTEEYVIPAETVDEGEVSQSGVFALFSTLIATASVNIESDANVFAPLSYIEATRTQTGSVNISAGIDADLPRLVGSSRQGHQHSC